MAISASLRISLYISALALIILRVELTLSEEIVSSRSKDVGSRSVYKNLKAIDEYRWQNDPYYESRSQLSEEEASEGSRHLERELDYDDDNHEDYYNDDDDYDDNDNEDNNDYGYPQMSGEKHAKRDYRVASKDEPIKSKVWKNDYERKIENNNRVDESVDYDINENSRASIKETISENQSRGWFGRRRRTTTRKPIKRSTTTIAPWRIRTTNAPSTSVQPSLGPTSARRTTSSSPVVQIPSSTSTSTSTSTTTTTTTMLPLTTKSSGDITTTGKPLEKNPEKPTDSPTKISAGVESEKNTTTTTIPTTTAEPSLKPWNMLESTPDPFTDSSLPTTTTTTLTPSLTNTPEPLNRIPETVTYSEAYLNGNGTEETIMALVRGNSGELKLKPVDMKTVNEYLKLEFGIRDNLKTTSESDERGTVSDKNSFTLPRGHYYFPKELTVLGLIGR